MQQHVRPGLAVLPAGVLDLDVAAAADAGHEDHGRGTDLIGIACVVAGAADPEHVGIAEGGGGIQDVLDQVLVEGGVADPPGLFDLDRAAVAESDIFEIRAQ